MSNSNTFITTEVRTTGLYSFRLLEYRDDNANLKHVGTFYSRRDQLKIPVKTEASWLPQYLKVNADTWSGPAAFLLFCLWRRALNLCSFTTKGGIYSIYCSELFI